MLANGDELERWNLGLLTARLHAGAPTRSRTGRRFIADTSRSFDAAVPTTSVSATAR